MTIPNNNPSAHGGPTKTFKPLQEHGHYTEVHDALFDKIMPVCPPNAWKVLCFVLRKTRGWQREGDRLSYAQIRKGTGIKSDATINQSLKWLTGNGGGKEKGYRLLKGEGEKDETGRQQVTFYSLNRDFELELPSTEIEEPSTVSKDGPATVSKDGPSTENEDINNHTQEQYPYSNNQREDARTREVATDTQGDSQPPTRIYSKVVRDSLSFLANLEGYPIDQRRNGEHLEKQCKKHPQLDIRREVEKFCDYYEEQGFEKKHKPRGRLTNWLNNAEEWTKCASARTTNKTSSRRPSEDFYEPGDATHDDLFNLGEAGF